MSMAVNKGCASIGLYEDVITIVFFIELQPLLDEYHVTTSIQLG